MLNLLTPEMLAKLVMLVNLVVVEILVRLVMLVMLVFLPISLLPVFGAMCSTW